MGKVYLIGAGPGDEELMTLKAVRVLKKCTAVLYDRLTGGNILKFLPENCEVFYCGKEPGCHYKTQEEINAILIELAKAGHTVGRIKGGDPYVFGRGGEEALSLTSEGIDFEVVPGVTSATAVLSYAGIPVTQRGISQSFHVITGRSASSLRMNWASLAKLEGTLIFLMGLESIELIAEKLLEYGKARETPCAVVMKGTTSKQKIVMGTLLDIAENSRRAELESPCIIVVGKTTELSNELNWYEKKPLFGVNICVARAKEQASGISEDLIELGAQVTEINSIRIESMAENLERVMPILGSYQYIVFTSANAVNIFFDYLRSSGRDIRKIKAYFAVIGDATEKALIERGVLADIKASQFTGEGLLKKIKEVVSSGDRILIPCSQNSRSQVEEELKSLNCIVDCVYTYKTVQGSVRNERAFQDVDAVVFTSPSTVKNMNELLGTDAIRSKLSIAIGPITYEALRRLDIEACQCDEYSQRGIINKIMELREKGTL